MRIALLIDAENISAQIFTRLVQNVQRHGSLDLCIAVGDFSRLPQWAALGGEGRLVLDMQASGGKGSNAADIALAIVATEVALSGRFDAIALATGDADLVPLVLRLRRHGLPVLGFATGNAGKALRIAYTRFEILEVPPIMAAPGPGTAAVPNPAAPAAPTIPRPTPEQLRLLRQALEKHCDKHGRIDGSTFGQLKPGLPTEMHRLLTPGIKKRLLAIGVVEAVPGSPGFVRMVPLRAVT